MSSNRKKLIAAVSVLALLAAAYVLFVRGRLEVPPELVKPPAPTPEKELSDDRHAALALYMQGPPGLPPSVARLELTLIDVRVKRGDGKEYGVGGGAPVRVALQKGVTQKLANDLIPAGPYGEILLSFAPAGQLIPESGAPVGIFLPNPKVTVSAAGVDLPGSRTLAAFFRMDLTDAFGRSGDVPTVTLPKVRQAETSVLGGIFRNDRSIGNLWTIPILTLRDAVKQDTGLDIASPPKQGASGGFTPPTSNPPQR